MFENIIGHDKTLGFLQEAIKSNNISHAYLFNGQKGIGKSAIAKEFAKLILKTDNLESNVDYKYIAKLEDKKDILVEQIRKELIDDIYIVPATSDKKVYVIDDAQDLNIAAQNALLKTLEEPPKYVVVILVSNLTSKFLPTIISRLNIINFSPLSKEELKKYFDEKYKVEINDRIYDFTNGSMGLLDEIMQKNMLADFNNIDLIYESIESKDSVKSLFYSQKVDFSNANLLDYLEFILYSNFKYSCVNIVEKAKERLKYNGNYDIVIDSMILKIIENS
ncbi:MAG: AAA family ATPase [Clostridia bacterium]|nr:AAA family ATPase [Clostridia bacterium]